jgi:hypothetical protein
VTSLRDLLTKQKMLDVIQRVLDNATIDDAITGLGC